MEASGNLGNLINNIVANKKYQVSIENLSLEGGYVDSQGNQFPARNGVSGYMRYLTEGTQRAGQASLGSPGIIGTTTKSVNGSPFIDIGLTFSGDFAVNGNPVQAEDQVPEALRIQKKQHQKLQQLHQLVQHKAPTLCLGRIQDLRLQSLNHSLRLPQTRKI